MCCEHCRLMRNVPSVDILDWSTTPCSCALLMRVKLSSMSAPPASESCPVHTAAVPFSPDVCLLLSGTSTLKTLDGALGASLAQLTSRPQLLQWLPAVSDHSQRQQVEVAHSADDWSIYRANFRMASITLQAAKAKACPHQLSGLGGPEPDMLRSAQAWWAALCITSKHCSLPRLAVHFWVSKAAVVGQQRSCTHLLVELLTT